MHGNVNQKSCMYFFPALTFFLSKGNIQHFNFLFMIRCCHLQLNKRQQNILLTRGFFATDFVVYTSQWGTKIIIHSFYFLKTAFLDFSRSSEVPSARPELFKALLKRDWKWPHLIKCKNIKKSLHSNVLYWTKELLCSICSRVRARCNVSRPDFKKIDKGCPSVVSP